MRLKQIETDKIETDNDFIEFGKTQVGPFRCPSQS